MDSRQRSVANSRQKSRTNSRQKSIANSGQGEPKDCDRDEAKFEENTAQRKAAVSQSQMSSRGDTSQQGRYELKLGEVITTIPNRRCPSCEATPGRHHRTAGRSAMKIQMDKRCVQHSSGSGAKKQTVFDGESRSRLELHWSFTVQKNQRRNEDDQLLSEGEPIRILGNTSTEGFGEGKRSE